MKKKFNTNIAVSKKSKYYLRQQSDEASSEETSDTPDYVLVIHGGVGTILKKNMSLEKEQMYMDVLNFLAFGNFRFEKHFH